VTIDDFERLTMQASRNVGRVRCVEPEPGKPVRILVVPKVDIPPQSLTLQDLALPQPLVDAVTKYLEDRRLLTTTIQIDEPYYQGLKVVAEVLAVAGIRAESIKEKAETALYKFINPVVGGPDGKGWPFGRTLHDSDIHRLLGSVPGVAAVRRVYFYQANMRTREIVDRELQRIALPPDALVMSFEHDVKVKT
jgi:predicted phage baseplate assembly protein